MKRFMVLIALLPLLLGFASCNGSVQQAMDELDRLETVSDSVGVSLEAIHPSEANNLFYQSTALKERFKVSVANDTLDLEFARQLDRYLQANKQLDGLADELTGCVTANEVARLRIRRLRDDISAGAGDRTRYLEYVGAETAEMKAIEMHAADIRQRFETAKSAIEQFQPAIERFISEFVPQP